MKHWGGTWASNDRLEFPMIGVRTSATVRWMHICSFFCSSIHNVPRPLRKRSDSQPIGVMALGNSQPESQAQGAQISVARAAEQWTSEFRISGQRAHARFI